MNILLQRLSNLPSISKNLIKIKRFKVPASNDASHPLAVVHAIQENVTDDMHVALDVGSHYIWMARHFRCYQPRHLLISNGMQTLGVGFAMGDGCSDALS